MSCISYRYFLVSERPELEYDKKFKSAITLKAGSTLSIPIDVSGFPNPTVAWTLNNKTVVSSGNIQVSIKDKDTNLTIKPCARTDTGVYHVSAENAVGAAHAEFEVIIQDRPSKPLQLEIVEVQRESISISWQKPEDDGGSPITGYIIEKRDAKKTSWSSAGKVKASELTFTVPKLIEGNEYYIRVSAVNDIDVGDPTETPEPTKAKSPFGKLLGWLLITYFSVEFLVIIVS